LAFGSTLAPLAKNQASPQPPLSGSRESRSKLLDSQALATGTNPRGSSRALQLPDAFRKLALLLRRYAHWATGPRNPASVAFSCFASRGDVLEPVGLSPGGPSRSPRERCGGRIETAEPGNRKAEIAPSRPRSTASLPRTSGGPSGVEADRIKFVASGCKTTERHTYGVPWTSCPVSVAPEKQG